MDDANNKKIDSIDEAAEETFPTSDPPSWTLGTNKEYDEALKAKAIGVLQVLIVEHTVIKKAAQALEKLLIALENNQSIDPKALRVMTSFLESYVIHRHHIKEEILFPLLKNTDNGLSDYLLHDIINEHEASRHLILSLKEMALSFENKPGQHAALVALLKDMKSLYLNHVAKEEGSIFPLINHSIDEQTNRDLMRQFEKIDEKVDREASKHLALIADLLNKNE